MNNSKLNSMTCTGIGFILASVVAALIYYFSPPCHTVIQQVRYDFFVTTAIANALVLGIMAIVIGWYFVDDEKKMEVK